MGVRYATREQVKVAPDIKSTRRVNQQIDRAIESASRFVDELCHRKFYPRTDTRYFDWPDRGEPGVPYWRLWLHQHEVISVSSLVAGGTTISSDDYFLEPNGEGPPYGRIDLDRSTSAVFKVASSGTPQRAIAVTGVFGGWDAEELIAEVSSTITAAHTTLTFSPEQIGVGDTVRIGSEYIHLTDLAVADTLQDTQAALTASTAAVAVTVEDGDGFAVGEVLQVGSEKMLVTAIAGDVLTVQRAYDGTVLAAHNSGVDIFAERAFTAERAALGTTAAEHSVGASVYKLTYPALVTDLTVAEAIVRVQNEQSGYSRMMMNWSFRALATGIGLDTLRDDCWQAHGRKMRSHAI